MWILSENILKSALKDTNLNKQLYISVYVFTLRDIMLKMRRTFMYFFGLQESFN